jgi:glycoprotein-N-acetylgalactosamine 3-beta-galactosyltransferase
MEDPELDTIVLNVTESRDALRNKTKGAFMYAHQHHLNDFDFFVKADEDE